MRKLTIIQAISYLQRLSDLYLFRQASRHSKDIDKVIKDIDDLLSKDQEIQNLEIIFRQLFGFLNEEDVKDLAYVLYNTRSLNNSEATYEKLKLSLNSYDYKLTTCLNFKSISKLLGVNGLYYFSYIFRNLALERAVADFEKDPQKYNLDEMVLAYKAYLDLGDMRVYKLLNNIKSRHKLLLPIKKMRTYADLVLNHSSNTPRMKPVFKRDKLFVKEIKDKNIGIYGPAKTQETDLESRIHNNDVVLLMNYSGDLNTLKNSNAKYISYYAGHRVLGLKQIYGKKRFENVYEHLNYTVFKNKDDFHTEKLNKLNSRLRFSVNYENYFFQGSPNLGPLIILDILSFTNRPINLYKNNMFLSNQPYDKSYLTKKHINRKITDVWRSHWTHDLLSQFNLIKNLHECKSLILDITGRDVFSLSQSEYIIKMEQIYVSKYLKDGVSMKSWTQRV